MESLTFLALTPLALTLMLVVVLVAWRRRHAPGAWGLIAFSGTSALWLLVDASSVAAPTAGATIRLAQAGLLLAPLPGIAWFWFLLSYTGRDTPRARRALAAVCAWCAGFAAFAVTNDGHGLVWASSEAVWDGVFQTIRYTLGPISWVQIGVMWGLTLASLGLVLWTYAGGAARERALSRWIVVGALAPMALNVVHMVGFGPIEKDFTPVAMAVASAAFGLGLTRYRLLDLLPIAREALVDSLHEGVLVLDADDRVADVNPALRHALGAERAVPGRRLRETAPALARAIDEAPGEVLRIDAASGPRYVDLHISPLRDDDGEPSGRLILLHDVTRRREERAALHRANADLYDANAELQARNDELDAFAHTVAHDLKNSVQGLAGWAEVLRDEGPALPPGEHREIASGIADSAYKMGTVIHELLLLAGVRKAAVEPHPIAMGDVVAAALDRLHRAGAPVAVAERPERWPVVRAHAPWVEEVWVNYLSNAAKYGGPTVSLGAERLAGRARFWVHDDGPGLSPEAQRQLFVPFSRVGSLSVEGHGLGLSIVRRITERLGGTCGVESAPGEGTRFWFAFPLAETDGEVAEVVAATAA